MGWPEFSDASMIDLDPAQRGYITAEQVQQLYEDLFFSSVEHFHVTSAIGTICGEPNNDLVKTADIIEVLQEIVRTHAIEEQAYWDFKSLDANADDRISLSDAFMLFQEAHGDNFSWDAWKRCLSARCNPEEDVSFAELLLWLCEVPGEDPTPECDLGVESQELDQLQQDYRYDQANLIKQWQGIDELEKQEALEYHEFLQDNVKRRIRKWDAEGVEALIFDNGLDADPSQMTRARDVITYSDLYSALDAKYEILRGKLLWKMVKQSMGPNSSEMPGYDKELSDTYREVSSMEQTLRQTKQLTVEKIHASVLGARLTHNDGSLYRLMGEPDRGAKDLQMCDEIKTENKSTAVGQLYAIMHREFHSLVNKNGHATYGELLVLLQDRYTAERSFLISNSKPRHVASGSKLTSLLHQWVCVSHQQVLIGREDDFADAAMANCLAEKVHSPQVELNDFDVMRNDNLARSRLDHRKGRQLQKASIYPSNLSLDNKPLGLMKSVQQAIVVVCQRQAEEREVMIHLLQGRESVPYQATANKMSSGEIIQHLNTLRRQWQSLIESFTADISEEQKQHQLVLLYEATSLQQALLHANREKSALPASVVDLNASLLSDVQVEQEREFHSVMDTISSAKGVADVHKLTSKEVCLLKNSSAVNIAAIVLGGSDLSEEEKLFMSALDAKYKMIREQIILYALRMQFGQAWNSISNDDRRKMLVEKKQEEKRLRGQDHLDKLVSVLGPGVKAMATLAALMGPTRGDFTSPSVPEESVNKPKSSKSNPLGELQKRYECERDGLYIYLSLQSTQAKGYKERRVWVVKMFLEEMVVRMEHDYEALGYKLGLSERIELAVEQRPPADVTRVQLLAKKYCAQSLWSESMQSQTCPLTTMDEDILKSDMPLYLPKSYIQQVLCRHLEECQFLLKIVQDDSLEELREVARMMTFTEQQHRLAELKNKRRQLHLEQQDNRDENVNILEEAAAIKTLWIIKELEPDKNSAKNKTAGGVMELVNIDLITQLLEKQDQELADAIQGVMAMDDDVLRRAIKNEKNARQWGTYENMVAVLTRCDAGVQEQDVIQALEDKYDALCDQLLLQSLMKQVGEKEWGNLTEQERQKKLTELRLKEKKLRKDGKYDDAAALLDASVMNESLLESLLGESRADQKQKVKDRLERRKQRIAQGMTKEACDAIDQQEIMQEEEMRNSKNILQILDGKYEQERDALLQSMNMYDESLTDEQKRQSELARLRREQKLLQDEKKFDAAATLLSMMTEQEKKLDKNKEEQRQRQEQLARERLAARRSQNATLNKAVLSTEILAEEPELNEIALSDAIIKAIEQRHHLERELLLQVFYELRSPPDQFSVHELSSEQRQSKVDEVRMLYDMWQASSSQDASAEQDEIKNMLISALAWAVAVNLHDRDSDSKTASSDKDASQVALFADLQEKEAEELKAVVRRIQDMNTEELQRMLKSVQSLGRYDQLKHLSSLLFLRTEDSGETDGETEVIQALDKKYDAIRDKMLLQVLETSMDRSSWKRLSQNDRLSKLVQLKMTEEQMRQGEDITDSELEQLLVNNQQDDGQVKKLLLSEIQQDYEAEKAALLSQMHRQSDRASAERERQQAIVVLHRDQRRLQQEQQSDAALLVWNLGQKHREGAEKSFTSERERQQELAKQRLAERQANAGRGQDKALVQSLDDVVLNEEEQSFQKILKSDASSLYEALLAVTEKIHSEERDSLLVLIDRVKRTLLPAGSIIQEVTQLLKDVGQNYSGWMKAKRDSDIHIHLDEMTSSEREAYYKDLTRERQAIMDRLEQAILYRVQLASIQNGVSVPDDALWEELSISLLTNLQQRQSVETNTLQASVTQSQDDQTLTKMYITQHQAHQQCWMVNLHKVVMAMPDVDSAAMETVAIEMKEKEGEEIAKLETDHVREKEEALKEARKAALAGDPVDVDAILKELEAQYQAKRQNLEDSFQKQHSQMMEKLEAKRFARTQQEYEEDSALHLVLLSSKQSDTMREKSAQEKERQQKLMQDRLTARREEARRKADAVVAAVAETEKEKQAEDADSRPSTSDSIQRDRSPLDITVTDDQKQEVYHRLMRQQTQLKLHITKEQSRQEEMLKRRLEQRRGQRHGEAAALLSLGERQKTTLETTQSVQRDRQLNMVRERVARVKYERTMTIRDPSAKAVTFDDDIDEEEEENTEQKHRRMSLLGRELEKKFKEGHSDQSPSQNSASQGATAESVLLGEEDKMARLKERRAQRRGKRQENRSS